MIIIVATDKLFASYDVFEAKIDSLIGVPKKKHKLAIGTYRGTDAMIKTYAKTHHIGTVPVGNDEKDAYQKYSKIVKQCAALDDECVFVIFAGSRDQAVEDLRAIGINNDVAVHIVNYRNFRVNVEV